MIKKDHENVKVLTASVTLFANSANSWDDVFESCDVNACINLNPNMIFAFVDGAAVVTTGSVDVPVIGGEVTLTADILNINCHGYD